MVLPVATYTDPMLSQPIRQAPWLTGIQTGVGLAGQIDQMRQKAALAPLTRGLTQAQTGLAQAQAQKALALSKSPFAGKILPGAAGRSQGMEIMKSVYGENSQGYKRALKDYNADVKLKLSRADYFSANVILKNVPELNKLQTMENYQVEQDARRQKGVPIQTFKQWYSPPSAQAGMSSQPGQIPSALTPSHPMGQPMGQPQPPMTTTTPTAPEQAISGAQHVPQSLAPQQAQMQPQMQQPQQPGVQPGVQPATAQAGITQEPFAQEAGQTGLAEEQKTIPVFAQQKLMFAQNIGKTLDRMPAQAAIGSYSEQPAKLLNDYRKSLDGNITPSYGKYLRFVTGAMMLSTQARQFYGDTIQETGRKRLDYLSNPINWRTNPKAALIKYNSMKDILMSEIDTYKDHYSGIKPIQQRPAGSISPTMAKRMPARLTPRSAQKTADNDPLGIR